MKKILLSLCLGMIGLLGSAQSKGYMGVGFEFDDGYDSYSRASYDYDDDDFSTSVNRCLFNIGVGAEYKITSKISAGLEIKYQYLKDFSSLPIIIGANYHF